MPDQDDGYQVIDQQEHDGETIELAVGDPPEPETPLEPETKPEDEVKPEDAEAHKKLTGSARAKAKAERLAEDLRQANERIAALERGGKSKGPKAPEAAGKPQQGDFETHAEWVEALTDWKYESREAERKAQEQTQKVTKSWEEKKEAARKELDDFDEVLADMEMPAPVVVAVMSESEHAAKIAYHLGQHPEELRKINQMTPPQAALAVARIEAGFSKVETPAPKPTTKAPAPMRPTQGGSVAPQEDAGYTIY